MIDAHIVPEHVLFLGPTNEGERFETLAFTDMLKVVAIFSKSEEGDKSKCKICWHIVIELYFFIVLNEIQIYFLIYHSIMGHAMMQH